VTVLKFVSLAALTILTPILGCGKILGIEQKQYSATGAGGQGGQGGQGGTATKTDCILINEDSNKKLSSLRVMNAIPGAALLDVCVRTSGSNDYGEAWFLANEESCGKGVAYSQYTTDLGLEPGRYDIKLIAANSKCSGTGLERTGVKLEENQSLSIFAFGESLTKGKLSIHTNRVPENLVIPIRFVNVLNGSQSLTSGIANSKAVPATFIAPIFVNVPLGEVSKESSGGPMTVDDVQSDGYTLFGGNETGSSISLGLAEGESNNPFTVIPITVWPGHAYTAFALGVMGSIDYRPKLWTCDENSRDGLFLACGNPVDVKFEVFNPNLADAFTPYIVERMSPATRAIVSEDTDVLCVTELFDPAATKLVKELKSTTFDYRVFSDDIPEAERGSLPLRQDGNPPEYFPTACPGELTPLFNAFLQCGIDNGCLTDQGGEHHLAAFGEAGTGCFLNFCGELGYSVMAYSDDSGAIPYGQGVNCYTCGLTHLSSYESSEATLKACTTDSDKPAHFAFGGTTGLAVLSKYPLGTPKLVLLPSTGWQRAAMRVPVTLPNGTIIDHWCGSLRFPNTEITLPYAGQYGMGAAEGGAFIEQQFEIETLVSAVRAQRNATGTLALVGLVTYASPELKNAVNKVLVNSQAAESYAKLDEVWPRLVAADYVPVCTFCGDENINPLNPTGTNTNFWSTHLFAEGISPEQVQSTERTFMEKTMTTNLGKGSIRTPVSQHFGLRSVVTITQ
jgi:hypothetical protein